MGGVFERVRRITKNIPAGRVMTYGRVADLAGVNSRVVGWALSTNRDLAVPCHRVVDKNGCLRGFNRGLEIKKKLLEEEGVEVKDGRVDLEKYLWRDIDQVC